MSTINLEVEFISNNESEDKRVAINNNFFGEASFFTRETLYVYDQELLEELKKYNIDQLLEFFPSMTITNDLLDNVYIQVEMNPIVDEEYTDITSPCMSAVLRFDIENWKKPWSITQYMVALSELIETDENVDFFGDIVNEKDGNPIYNLYNGVGILFKMHSTRSSFKKEYDNIIILITKLNSIVEDTLISKLDIEKLVVYFNFPAHIKAPCEQYLIYFSQFLKDLGIESETQLENVNNSVTLKVTPINSEVALTDIRELLGFYLNIATDENVNLYLQSNRDISSRQFEANIMHLKSQLMLAEATIEAKNTTIENLRLSKYIIEGKTITENQGIEITSNKDSEEILGGIITLTEKEITKGISVNFAKIVRRLRRLK